jgi:hypothetical protein
MNRTLRIALLSLPLLLAAPARAEDARAGRPGPEHQKLGYFVGKWKGTAMARENPFLPAGTFTSTETCEWFEGRFAVVCRSTGKGPAGTSKGITILGWSGEEKAYLYYGLDSTPMAMTTVPKGTLEGDTWTFIDDARMGGQMVKSRYVMKVRGKDAYDFRWEMLAPDGQWKAVMEGVAHRAR